MTDPQAVPARQGGSVEDILALVSLKRQAHQEGADVVGLIPDRLVDPPLDVVEDIHDTALWDRVALSLVKESQSTPDNREFDAAVALRKAGLSVEMWLQLSANPDFIEHYKRVYFQVVGMPRLPGVLNATFRAAAMGSEKAQRHVMEMFTNDAAAERRDLYAEYQRGGVRRVEEEVANLVAELQSLAGDMKRSVGDPSVIGKALADAQIVEGHAVAKPIDHATVFKAKDTP